MYVKTYNINIKQIIFYKTQDDKCPYYIWFNKLDKSIKARILTRLEKLEEGHYGDFKKLSNDLYELRCKFGSGYRIYFSEVENIIIIILCAGDKSTQSKDIEKAKLYIKDYKERYKND